MASRAHVLALSYPAQGHVIPMMELAQGLAQNGIKITIVNTDFIHQRMKKVLSCGGNDISELINFTSIPDGLEPWEDRNDVGKVIEATYKTMQDKVEALVKKINQTEDDDKVTCLIVDYGLKWPSEVARKLEIKTAAFLTAAAAWVALSKNDSQLINQGIIDSDGTPLKREMIQLSPEMPAISSTDFLWTCMGDSTTQKIMFHANSHNAKSLEKSIDYVICNSSYELEPGALNLVPRCLSIGPLLGKPAGHFWTEDSASLSWIDQQPPNSTIYVSFGSSTILDQTQFQELAIGLQITNRPFLWVVRPDLTKDNGNSYPEGFLEEIKHRGKIVEWAPQLKVLSHPSVACFMSHCGWNSTIESVISGVPFLCWPYSADQFLNQGYIVSSWEVGLGLEKDESGVVGREEIKNKVQKLSDDGGYKTRALELQAKTKASVGEGGSSQKNFQGFVNWIKENN